MSEKKRDRSPSAESHGPDYERSEEKFSRTKKAKLNDEEPVSLDQLNSTSYSSHEEYTNKHVEEKYESEGEGNSVKSGNRAENDGSVLPNKVFCGGLSWSTTEEGLRFYFSKYGEVSEVVLMKDRMTGKPRGFAFVSFTSSEAVKKATAKQMHEIDGKSVEVKNAFVKGTNGPVPNSSRQRDDTPSSNSCKLFVGGIAPETTDQDMMEYFSKFGEVTQTVVMRDSQTNRNRGFGFVTFAESKDAEKVLNQRKDHILKSKRVDVKSYKGRQAGGAGGASRGGYSGQHYNQGGYGRNYNQQHMQGGMYQGQGYGQYGGYGGQQMYYGYQNPMGMQGMGMNMDPQQMQMMGGYNQGGYYGQQGGMGAQGQGYDNQGYSSGGRQQQNDQSRGQSSRYRSY
eukprot:augustus_masked-scaffold_9-processed-gene-4.55-mRNA-1 protein AED:0.13 eAED:0.13 QI:333/1/1/1/0.33/0.5/4/21/395